MTRVVIVLNLRRGGPFVGEWVRGFCVHVHSVVVTTKSLR